MTKNKQKSNTSKIWSTKSCVIDKDYENHFFSSSHKIDYSNFFFDESEFNYENPVKEKDEIFEESPEILKKGNSEIKLAPCLKIEQQDSLDVQK